MSRLFVYAHRGASAEAPENTLAAFRRALAAGADGVELDVHLSSDAVPMVIHDDTLERTTDGAGPVAGWTAEELQALDAGSWFDACFARESVPTLAKVLHLLAGRVRINIEIKDRRAGEAVCALLRQFPAADIVVSSFDRRVLAALRRLDERLPLAVLSEQPEWRRLVAWAGELRAAAVHLRADMISRPLLAACRSAGLPVLAWTVDDPGAVRCLARAGIAGVFTNDPSRLRPCCPVGMASLPALTSA